MINVNGYSFNEFESSQERFALFISVGKTSRLNLSTPFIKKYDIEKYAGVKLMWDDNKKAIGFIFLKQQQPGMLKVKILKNGGSHINAKEFFAMFDINPEKYLGRYKPEEIEKPDGGTVFVIQLKEKTPKKDQSNSDDEKIPF